MKFQLRQLHEEPKQSAMSVARSSLVTEASRRAITSLVRTLLVLGIFGALFSARGNAGEEGLPEEAGNIGTGGGGPATDVLFVNGQTGNARNVVLLPPGTPLTMTAISPPAGPANAEFVLYARFGEPTPGDLRSLPLGTGTMVLPNPVTDGGGSGTLVLANSIGFPGQLGNAIFPLGPAPLTLLSRPGGTSQVGTVTFQAIMRDFGAPNTRAGVSNALIVKTLPPAGAVITYLKPQEHDVVVRNVLTGAETLVTVGPISDEDVSSIDAQGGIVAFASNEAGTFDIYTFDTATGMIQRETTVGGNETFPQISADGVVIAYEAGTISRREIRLYNRRTQFDRPIIRGGQSFFSPDISGDGNWVACSSFDSVTINNDVYLYDCRNNNLILASPDNTGADDSPATNYNGLRTAFRSFRTGDAEIWVYNRQSGSLVNVSQDNTSNESQPDISGDGRYVAYRSNTDGNTEIYLYDFNVGPPAINITNDPGADARPAFTTDGKFLFFETDRTGTGDIYRYEIATGMTIQVTNGATKEASVSSN